MEPFPPTPPSIIPTLRLPPLTINTVLPMQDEGPFYGSTGITTEDGIVFDFGDEVTIDSSFLSREHQGSYRRKFRIIDFEPRFVNSMTYDALHELSKILIKDKFRIATGFLSSVSTVFEFADELIIRRMETAPPMPTIPPQLPRPRQHTQDRRRRHHPSRRQPRRHIQCHQHQVGQLQ